MRRFQLLCVLIPVLLAGSPGCSRRPSGIPWRPDFEQGLKDGERLGKPVLTYLYTDSCTYCKEMEATTFKDPLLVDEMGDSYIWIKLNAETDPVGSKLREGFSVSSYPTILVTDYDGSEIDRLTGYVTASDFKSRVEHYLNSPDSFKRLKEKVESDPSSIPAHFSLARKYLERGRLFPAAKEFVQVIVGDPENTQKLTDTSYYFLAHTLATGGQPDEALNQLATLSEKFPESPVLPDAYLLEGQIHTFANRPREASLAFNRLLERYPDYEQRPWVEQLLKELDASEEMPLARSH